MSIQISSHKVTQLELETYCTIQYYNYYKISLLINVSVIGLFSILCTFVKPYFTEHQILQ